MNQETVGEDTAVAIFASVSSDDELERTTDLSLVEATCETVDNLSGVTNFLVGDQRDSGDLKAICRGYDNCRLILTGPEGETGLREKVRQTARSLFERGYDRVLLMAADVPTLSREDIQTVIRRLQSSDGAVIGPSPDGGFNYLGLAEWRGDFLKNVPFFTDRTRARLLERLRELDYQITVHDSHRDIDQPQDWMKVSSHVIGPFLLKVINRVRLKIRQWSLDRTAHSPPDSVTRGQCLTRAPPL